MTQSPTHPEPAPDPLPPAAAAGAPVPTAPAVTPPRWTGRKTAVVAALAVGVASLGAVEAAAALPAGTDATPGPGSQGRGGPPGRMGPAVPGGDPDLREEGVHDPAMGSSGGWTT